MDSKLNIQNGVYLISPEEISNEETFTQELDFIFTNSNVRIFQLRIKNHLLESTAEKIKKICDNHKVLFVLNDNLGLARKNGYALHIGKTDGDFNIAKSKLQIVGVSCYNDVERALQMSQQGASYVSFGAFFQSPTKPNAIPCPVSIIKDFKIKNSTTKVTVIGGINSTNAKPLIEEGANFICVCSAIWSLKTNEEKVKEINRIFSFFS